MKKILTVLSILSIFVACNEDLDNSFTPSDQTDTVSVNGQLEKIAYDAAGNQINVPHAGAIVTITVENRDLYPNSSNPTGVRTYTSAPADSNGVYSISGIKISGQNTTTPARINFVGRTGTRDTIVFIDGAKTVRTGRPVIYTDVNQSITLRADAKITNNYSRIDGTSENFLSDENDSDNNLVIGSAIVKGQLTISLIEEDTSGGITTYSLNNFNLPNHPVKLVFDKDPKTQVERIYETVTDAEGRYTFNIETSEDGNFNNSAELIAVDFATTQDTVLVNGTRVTGDAGVFEESTRTVNGLDPFEIRVAENLSYTNFTRE